MASFSGHYLQHPGPALAAFLQSASPVASCTPASNDLACRLDRLEGVLDTTAVILGIILVIAVVVALRFWLRHRAAERREESRRGPDRVIR